MPRRAPTRPAASSALPAPAVAVLSALAALALADCGAGGPSFREVSARQGRTLAAREGCEVVQVGRAPFSLAIREGARLVPDAGWEWPPEVTRGPVVIVAVEPEAGYRLAARMARAGIQDVAVVAGGVDAWNEERALARTGSEADSEGESTWPQSPM